VLLLLLLWRLQQGSPSTLHGCTTTRPLLLLLLLLGQ
jgi:hypothetical protein